MAERFVITLPDGNKLVAEKSADPQYPYEMYVGIESKDGAWVQDLAYVGADYRYKPENGDLVIDPEHFNVYVYADETTDDYTDKFTVGLYHEPEEEQPKE